jgi:hypothetical protein
VQKQQEATQQQEAAQQQQLEAERQRAYEAERQQAYEAQQAQQELDQQRQLDESNRNAAEQQQQQTDEGTRRAYDQLQEQQNQQLKDRQQLDDAAESQRKVQNDQIYYDQLRRDEQQEAQEQQNQDYLDRQNEEYDRQRAEQEQRDRESILQEEEDDARNSPTVPENNDGIVDGDPEVVSLSCEEVEILLAREAALAESGDCDFPVTEQIKRIRTKEMDATLFRARILAVLSLASKKNNDCYINFIAGDHTYSYGYFKALFIPENARHDICDAETTGSMPTVEGLYNNSYEYKIRMKAVLLKRGLPLVLGGKTGYEFHHRIPKRYNDPKTGVKVNDQREVDFDYHAPENIRIVPWAIHRQISKDWSEFDKDYPNATWDQINDYANIIDLAYSEYYLYKFLYQN